MTNLSTLGILNAALAASVAGSNVAAETHAMESSIESGFIETVYAFHHSDGDGAPKSGRPIDRSPAARIHRVSKATLEDAIHRMWSGSEDERIEAIGEIAGIIPSLKKSKRSEPAHTVSEMLAHMDARVKRAALDALVRVVPFLEIDERTGIADAIAYYKVTSPADGATALIKIIPHLDWKVAQPHLNELILDERLLDVEDGVLSELISKLDEGRYRDLGLTSAMYMTSDGSRGAAEHFLSALFKHISPIDIAVYLGKEYTHDMHWEDERGFIRALNLIAPLLDSPDQLARIEEIKRRINEAE
jgi:hypothetical protein